MKHTLSSAVGVARLIERLACAVRFRNKKGEGKISTEAIASILAHPGEPIFSGTGSAGAQCWNFSFSPPLRLCPMMNHESMSNRFESSTAVQHLTKALFLSKPARPPLSLDSSAIATNVLRSCKGFFTDHSNRIVRQPSRRTSLPTSKIDKGVDCSGEGKTGRT